jgi:hypothetical protein
MVANLMGFILGLQLNAPGMVLTTKNTKITKGKHIIFLFSFVSFVPFGVMVVSLELSAYP